MDGQLQVIGNRKNKDKDQQNIPRKAKNNNKKNLNKTINQNKMINQIKQKREESSYSQFTSKANKLNDKQFRKIQDIKAILEFHKRSTIQQMLERNDWNKDEAMEQLFSIPEDEITEKKVQEVPIKQKNPAKKKEQQSQQDIANEILNQIYENQQEIDPSEFEDLFAEITSIIKEDEKINMGVFEINEFIDDCYLVKKFILENQSEIYVDMNDELYKNTEIFLEEYIKNQVAREAKRKQDFPTLGSIQKKINNSNNTKGYIQKIQDGYNQDKMKEEYFVPSKVPQVYQSLSSQHEQSVFSVNNDRRSYEDVKQLNEEYNDMGIDNLKFIYIRLQDLNLCKTFLDRFYPERKRDIIVEKFQDKKKVTEKKSPQKINIRQGKSEDENFKNCSLNEIRAELDHLFKLRGMFRMTRGKTSNALYKKQLQRLACRQNPRIQKLIQVARDKAVREMCQYHPLYIDLHGYREQEIDPLFDEIEDMIRNEFQKGNSQLETCKIGYQVCCNLKVMTGKGLHSKYNKSILKPAVINWCQSNNYKFKETGDSVLLSIPLR